MLIQELLNQKLILEILFLKIIFTHFKILKALDQLQISIFYFFFLLIFHDFLKLTILMLHFLQDFIMCLIFF